MGENTCTVARAYVGEREHTPNRQGRFHTNAQTTYTKAMWPALVNRTKFLAVQRMLKDPSRVTIRPGRAKHLLSLIAACDPCGGPLAVKRVDGPEPIYTCNRGGHVTVPRDELDQLAEEIMIAYLAREDNVTRLTAEAVDPEQLQAVQDDIADIRLELDDLAAQLADGKLSATLAAKAEPGILKRLKAAEDREAELSTPDTLRALIKPGAGVQRRWKAAPMEVRRRVARILLAPNAIGELRILRSPNPRRYVPVADRVTIGGRMLPTGSRGA